MAQIFIQASNVGKPGPAGPAGGAPPLVSTQQSGTTYTLVAGDSGTVVEFTNASAVTVTVPPSVFSTGQVVEIFQYGAGQVTLSPGSGVTLRSDASRVKTAGQYATIGLRCRASNEFVVSGDVA